MSGADVDPIRGQKFAPFLLVSPEPLSRDQNRSERLPGVIDEHLMEVDAKINEHLMEVGANINEGPLTSDGCRCEKQRRSTSI